MALRCDELAGLRGAYLLLQLPVDVFFVGQKHLALSRQLHALFQSHLQLANAGVFLLVGRLRERAELQNDRANICGCSRG